MNIQKMNIDAQRIALEMKAKFPELSNESIGKMAKFIVLSATAINECNEDLSKSGHELNEKGYEIVFNECGKHCLKGE